MIHHQRHQYAVLLAAAIAFTQTPAIIGQTLPTAAPSEPTISPAGEQALQLLRLAAAREQAEKRAQQADDLRAIHSQLSQMHAELQMGSPSPQRQDEMATQVGGFAAEVQAMAQSQPTPASAELKDAAGKLEAAQRELASHDARPNTLKPSMDAIARAYDQTIGRAAHLAEVKGSVESLQKQLSNARSQPKRGANAQGTRKTEATLKAIAQRSGKLQSQLDTTLGPQSSAAKGFNDQVRDVLQQGSTGHSSQTSATTRTFASGTGPATQATASAAQSPASASQPSASASGDTSQNTQQSSQASASAQSSSPSQANSSAQPTDTGQPHGSGSPSPDQSSAQSSTAGQPGNSQSPAPGQGESQSSDPSASATGEQGSGTSPSQSTGESGQGNGSSQARTEATDQPPTGQQSDSGMPGLRSDANSGEGQANEQMVTERVNEVLDALQKVSDEIDQQLAQLRQKDLLRAMGDEEVPPEYRDLVNAYFERLSKQASPAPARAPARK